MPMTPTRAPGAQGLVVLWRQLVVNIPNKGHPHLCRVVAAQNIADEMGLDLHLHHLQGTTKDAAVYVGEPQLILRSPVVWKLDEVCEGIFVKDKGELLAVARPIGDLRSDVQEDLESDLTRSVSIFFVASYASASLTLAIMSAVSLKLAHRFMVLDLAR